MTIPIPPPFEMSTADLASAADENLATHFGWVQARIQGMLNLSDNKLVLVDCGMPCETFNAVCRTRLGRGEAPQRIRDVITWYEALGHPFSWWTGPVDRPTTLGELLLAAGLEEAEAEEAMAADLSALHAVDPSPDGLDVRRVRTEEELADFAAINAANWTPPDPYVTRFYERAAPLVLRPKSALRYYVGYLDGEPVATSELTLGGGVAGLYNISTLGAYRRRGFGSALTLRPLLDARSAGYHTAVLQAASGSVGVYKRVGFSTFGTIVEFKPSSPPGTTGP